MITGNVSAKALLDRKRMDAEFHLCGQRLKAKLVARTYAVELSDDEEEAIKLGPMSFMALAHHCWIELGAHDMQFHERYREDNAFICFEVDVRGDKFGKRKLVLDAIRDHITHCKNEIP